MPSSAPIFLIFLFSSFVPLIACSNLTLTLPHQHPDPESVVQELHRRVNLSLSRRLTLSTQEEKDQLSCVTGNPIDDCWRCDPNWANNRQHLAECAIGFGQNALGGKGGPIYVVTDPSDPDPDKLRPGTLRDAVTRPGPLWIIFSVDMHIKLERPLAVSSFKTIDGRGVNVHVTGAGCILMEHVTNVIVNNINIHHCRPQDSDGDGLHIYASSHVWVDHCSLADCADGLIDCTVGSTAITISNCYFFRHDKVMLLGHSDDYPADRGMQVTVAFNRFGLGLGQRMPRCRFGYFHVVNNDYAGWQVYAIGGSSAPTINSQGNRYTAPVEERAKEVTRRMQVGGEQEWEGWNWRTEGDLMVNGAFFVPSGDGVSAQYALASSVEPRSANFINELTVNAGVMIPQGNVGPGISNPGSNGGGSAGSGGSVGGGTGILSGYSNGGNPGSNSGDGGLGGNSWEPGSNNGDGGYYGMIFRGNSSPPSLSCQMSVILSLIIILTVHTSFYYFAASFIMVEFQ